MKKMFCLILAVVLLCASFAYSEEAAAPAAGTKLGFELLRNLYDGSENQVISPVSLSFALAMAAQGAEGETGREILDAMEADDLSGLTDLMETLAEKGLKQASAAFSAGELTPDGEYVKALKEMFGAEWFESAENMAENVNRWVNEQTDGMIDRIFEEELPAEVMLVLANAIAMDAKWMREFDPLATEDDVFYSPDGEVTVPFMHNEFWADYGERDGVQLLRLQYRNDEYEPTGLTMLIALPEEGGMEEVLDGLCGEGLGYFTFREEEARVRLSMPKTDISADNTLNDALKALGVKTAFSDEADFSGITKDAALKIGAVRQKARLIMDEEGTKAAAATAVTMMETALIPPDDIVEFSMNRPFVLAVADEETGAVCFAAAVTNPIAN